MRDFKKVGSDNYTVNQVQENLAQFFKQFQDNPLLTGILHKDVVVNTSNFLDHKLGRVPIGYIVVKRDTNTVIWNGESDSRTIKLNSSTNAKIDVWVF